MFLDESGFAHDRPPANTRLCLKRTTVFSDSRLGCKRTHQRHRRAFGKDFIDGAFVSNNHQHGHFQGLGEAGPHAKMTAKECVVLDNATFHKGVEMGKSLRNCGAYAFISAAVFA